MKRLILAFTALAFVALPATTTGQLAPVPGSTEYLDFLSGGNPDKVAGSYGIPYYVGPYTAQFRSGPGGSITSPNFSIYCVDVLHTAGDQWVASTLIGPGATDSGMGATRVGATTGAVDKYRAGAYLASLFDSYTAVSSNKSTAYSIIHSAIWKVVQGQNVGNSTLLAWRDNLLASSAAAMASYDAAGWYVLSPVSPYNGQEFLIRTNVVPEPSTYLLLATGLLFLVGFGRKRFVSRRGGDLAA